METTWAQATPFRARALCGDEHNALRSAQIVPSLASHFAHARLQHLDDKAAALAWLELPPVHRSQSQGKESFS
jgi:hypothetical protein